MSKPTLSKLMNGGILTLGLSVMLGCGNNGDTEQGDPQPTRSVRNLSPEQLFMHCRACHGATGQGIANLNPPLDGSPYLEGDDANLARIILHGYRSGQWSGIMTGFARNYSDDEVATLVNWMRARWAPQAGDMQPETVAQVRHAERQRRRPWSREELAALTPTEDEPEDEHSDSTASDSDAEDTASDSDADDAASDSESNDD